MSPFKILYYTLAFWHRKWELIDSWVQKYQEKEYVYMIGIHVYEKSRRLILERCQYSGFERAYFCNGDGYVIKAVDVSWAKAKLKEKNEKIIKQS
jgi:hypothetical protein